MRNKYYILVLTFLCLLVGNTSYGQLKNGDFYDLGNEFTQSELDEINKINNDDDPTNDLEIVRFVDPDKVGTVDQEGKTYVGDVIVRLKTDPNSNSSSGDSSSGGSSSGGSSSGGFSSWGGGYGSTSTSGSDSCPTCNTGDDSSNDVASADGSIVVYVPQYYGSPSNGEPSIIYDNSNGDSYPRLSTEVATYNSYYYTQEVITPSGVDLFTDLNQPPYGKVDNDGNVTILTRDGTYKSPSQINPEDDKDRYNLSKFAVYLIRKTGTTHLKDITVTTKNSTDISFNNPASSAGAAIYINRNGGFSKFLDNAYSFQSILIHEMYHVDDYFDKILVSYESHADVYLRQMKDDTFKHTPYKFQLETASSFCNYLLNIDQYYVRLNENYDHYKKVISRINQFNLDHQGKIYIEAPEFGQYSLGNLSLSVKMNGYESVPIKYKYEKN